MYIAVSIAVMSSPTACWITSKAHIHFWTH